jgi:hypothetical protein
LADAYLLILDVRRNRLAASAPVSAPATGPTDDERDDERKSAV